MRQTLGTAQELEEPNGPSGLSGRLAACSVVVVIVQEVEHARQLVSVLVEQQRKIKLAIHNLVARRGRNGRHALLRVDKEPKNEPKGVWSKIIRYHRDTLQRKQLDFKTAQVLNQNALRGPYGFRGQTVRPHAEVGNKQEVELVHRVEQDAQVLLRSRKLAIRINVLNGQLGQIGHNAATRAAVVGKFVLVTVAFQMLVQETPKRSNCAMFKLAQIGANGRNGVHATRTVVVVSKPETDRASTTILFVLATMLLILFAFAKELVPFATKIVRATTIRAQPGQIGALGRRAVIHAGVDGRLEPEIVPLRTCAKVTQKKNSCAMCKLVLIGDRGKIGKFATKTVGKATKHVTELA